MSQAFNVSEFEHETDEEPTSLGGSDPAEDGEDEVDMDKILALRRALNSGRLLPPTEELADLILEASWENPRAFWGADEDDDEL